MKNLENLSREEIIRLIEEQAKKINAIVTKNKEHIDVMARANIMLNVCRKRLVL